MEYLPAARDTNAPALTGPALLEQWERLEAAVKIEREKKASQEARDREARSRELDVEARRYEIWQWGPLSNKRSQERLALAEEQSARVAAINRAEDVEQRALLAEFNRRKAEIHARYSERRVVEGRRIEQETAALRARQQAEFDPGAELLAGWEAARLRKIADLKRDAGSRQRQAEELAEWDEFHPRPVAGVLGRR